MNENQIKEAISKGYISLLRKYVTKEEILAIGIASLRYAATNNQFPVVEFIMEVVGSDFLVGDIISVLDRTDVNNTDIIEYIVRHSMYLSDVDTAIMSNQLKAAELILAYRKGIA